MSNLAIYHAVQINPLVPCRDGLVAASICNKALPQCDFLGWHYSQNSQGEFPDVSYYSQIFILDFHFPRSVLQEWIDQGKTVHLIDHHESTLNALSTFSENLGKRFRYDRSECGATLAWKYFFPYNSQPAFLKYIRDRDNYYKQLPFTEEVHSAFGSLLWKGDLYRAFEVLEALSEMSEQDFLDFMVPIGEPLAARRREKIENIIRIANKKNKFSWVEVEGYTVPMIQLNKSDEQYRSDVGEYLYRKFPEVPFVVLAKATGGYSLRSDQFGMNFNILDIAGVEGHRNAGSTDSLLIKELTAAT